MANQTDILTPEVNRLNNLRKHDNEVGTFISDIIDYCEREDWKRAATAAGYLLFTLAKRAGLKPFTILRKVNS